MLPLHRADPRGYVRTAFESALIEPETCRFLILEWALKLPQDVRPAEAARVLLAEFHVQSTHPMYQLLGKVLADPVPAAQNTPQGRAGLHQDQ
ncbi:hypothetical protein [Thioclava sp. GXIMD4215]|uniref:hypothetical protein n=1 Tax=Thioclava sp. GXIMD4215 TaxID=3131928 RepID=UPI00324B1456